MKLSNKTKHIMRLPEQIPSDKRLHFMIGTVLTAILTIFTVNVFIVMPTLITLAWGIELFQKWTKSGQFDHYDALSVVAGGLIVYLSHIL